MINVIIWVTVAVLVLYSIYFVKGPFVKEGRALADKAAETLLLVLWVGLPLATGIVTISPTASVLGIVFHILWVTLLGMLTLVCAGLFLAVLIFVIAEFIFERQIKKTE